MSGRDLGKMTIANDVVTFEEGLLTVDDRNEFGRNLTDIWPYPGWVIVAEWHAHLDDKIIACGWLFEELTRDVVYADVYVLPDHRGYGIGSFMGRIVTDLAIRQRRRRIIVQFERTNAAARAIAMEQDFEDVPGQETQMCKELKWM